MWVTESCKDFLFIECIFQTVFDNSRPVMLFKLKLVHNVYPVLITRSLNYIAFIYSFHVVDLFSIFLFSSIYVQAVAVIGHLDLQKL